MYNSVHEFLVVHTPDLTRLMAAAQQATGGYYATLDPLARAATTLAEAQWVIQDLHRRTREPGGEPRVADAGAPQIPYADRQRREQEFTQRLEAFAVVVLADQPGIYHELARRLEHRVYLKSERVRGRRLPYVLELAVGRATAERNGGR